MADSIVAREQSYSDFDLAFRSNPVTGDISLKKNEQAVKQSVLNILLTKRGEKPFDPNFGSDITSQLFENFDPIIETVLDEQIRTALKNYEPRVKVLDTTINGSPDQNSIDVTLTIRIQSPEQTETTVNFSVERLR